jgi:hypothetical protein
MPARLRAGSGRRRAARPYAWLLPALAAAVALACGGGGAGEARAGAGASPPAATSPSDPAFAGDPDRPPGAPPGKWRAAQPTASPELDERDRALLATPYLQGYRPASAQPAAVSRHDPARAEPGLNLYTSGHAAEAILMDMQGTVLHRWRLDLARLWPDTARELGPDLAPRLEYWRRAALLPDGGLIAIYEGLGVVRLDRRSRVVWAYRGGAHHDLDVRPDGTIWVLDRRPARLAELPGRTVLEDLVTVLGPDGAPRRHISVLQALARSRYAPALRELPDTADVLHTNTLERLGGDAAAMGIAAVRPGHLLLSLLTLDAIAVLDPEREEIVWMARGEWRRQHQPTLLAGGELLLFDNGGQRGASQVLQLAPGTGRVSWRWPGAPDAATLWSKTLGSVQRLPGGNTLITESENGRALEVTPGGDVVWEFRSPHRAGESGELVATLFEVLRLPVEQPWLAAQPRPPALAEDRR